MLNIFFILIRRRTITWAIRVIIRKRTIIKKVAITEKDREEYSITEDSKAGKVTWDAQKDMDSPLVVDFTTQEIEYLKKSCESLVESAYPDDLWVTVEKIYNASNA